MKKNYQKGWSNKFRILLLSVLILGTSALSYGRGAGVVSKYGRLQVYNAHVCAENGTQISLGGMSFFWSNWSGSYYTASTVNYLVDQMQASVVRAAYGCPVASGPDGDYSKIYAVVDAAIAKGVYVIIDWHTEGNAWAYRSQAEAFFATMAQKYGSKPNVIYEPWNEPTDQSASSIKDWCQVMINIIRQYDPDNLVICGSGTWSQYPNSYSISDPNVAYTFHGYFDDGNGANHRSQFYNNVAAAMNMGNAVFVTEFGANYGTTSGSSEIIAKCQEWKISMCAWSVNDKVEPWSIFCSGSGTSCLTDVGNFYKSKLSTWPDADNGGSCTEVAITSQIEAENYCQMSGIKTETCGEGGTNVGYIDANDWMTYKVYVATAGSYTINYRVASLNGGGQIQLEQAGGGVVYGTVNVPSTGAWQTWTTVSHTVTLPAGNLNLAIKANTGGFNLNWWGNAGNGGSGFSQTIQAEDYAAMSGVDKETTTDAGGGQNVGWIDTGDWMSYTSNPVAIPSTGTYTIEFRVASSAGGGKIQFEEAGGATIYGSVSVASTGGWQNWTTVSMTATLSAGTHKFGIKALAGGFNLNWFKISQSSTKSGENFTSLNDTNKADLKVYPNPVNDILTIDADGEIQVQIFDIQGKEVFMKDLGTDRQISVENLKSGIYIIKVLSENQMFTTKLIKR